jgi:hypothetical protein
MEDSQTIFLGEVKDFVYGLRACSEKVINKEASL